MNTRQRKILELFTENNHLSVNELSQKLLVSEVTIRSDLDYLAEERKIVRTHGGAELLENRLRHEKSFDLRKKQNIERKLKIGRKAIEFVYPLDPILLDSSTTALTMATQINEAKHLKDITVIPTGIWAIMELMGNENLNILVPSGYLRAVSGSITGLSTNNFFKEINIHKAFLGAWGVSTTKGLTDSHLLEIELKKHIVNCAEEIIVLADGSKFSQSGLASYADLNQVNKIITDDTAPRHVIEDIREKGIDVIIAD
jgi:DeoR/GlpR family transcriptional regulator of sugar metabolism